jgi:hypothetical protein
MKQHNYTRYFRVFKDDTSVTEISTNDFLPVKPNPANDDSPVYQLPVNERLYYGYLTKAKAMEMAKGGALEHINLLLDQNESGEKELYQYRFDHFQDLTVNLVEANIEQIESEQPEKDVLINPNDDSND